MNITQRSQLPSINQIVVNKEFIGLASELQDRRRERRSVDEQEKALASRVQSLQLQNKRTNKQIKEKQERLAGLLAVRKRQQGDRQFKDNLARSKQRMIEQFHTRAQMQRENHDKNMESATMELSQQNRQLFMEGRKRRFQREHVKEINKYVDLQEKQDRVDSVNAMKQTGRIKVVKFKQEKNSEFIEEYKSRIDRQELKKSWKFNIMKTLQKKQEDLIQKLQKSSAQHQMLKQSFQKASKLNLKELQNCVIGNLKNNSGTIKNTLDTRSGGASFYQDRKMSLLVGRSRDRLNLQEYKKNRRSQLSNTVDISLHKPSSLSNKEIATPKVGLRGDPNIQEELIYGKDDEESKEFNRAHKRKRNRHMNRYKDYEIF